MSNLIRMGNDAGFYLTLNNCRGGSKSAKKRTDGGGSVAGAGKKVNLCKL